MLRTHIDLLSKDLKCDPALSVNEKREAIIEFSDGLAVTIHEDETKIWFKTTYSTLYIKEKEILYTEMMKGNFLGIETGHGAIGLSLDGQKATFCKSISINEAYHDFKEALEDFMNFSSYWKQKIDKLQNANPAL